VKLTRRRFSRPKNGTPRGSIRRLSSKEVRMATAQASSWQTWNSGPFSMERKLGKEGTVILRFRGPFTMRDVYSCLEPTALNKMLALEPEPGEPPVVKNILDLTECPYMDSSGLGIIVTHMVRCQKKGIKMVAAGISPRVKQVMQITKVDGIITSCGSVDEAENC
jgi:anti-anti-sigma factor